MLYNRTPVYDDILAKLGLHESELEAAGLSREKDEEDDAKEKAVQEEMAEGEEERKPPSRAPTLKGGVPTSRAISFSSLPSPRCRFLPDSWAMP